MLIIMNMDYYTSSSIYHDRHKLLICKIPIICNEEIVMDSLMK